MGKAKLLIDELVRKKAQGDAFQERNVRIKLILKGIMPDKITADTPDTDEMIAKIYEVAENFNIQLSN
ncbi:hypothetical protein SAMN06265379_101864 [Saccharicrinis carchari]|uniref:Uncharacterized protein n=1 Tax=Saccharicrinis carchari TaxID=1168039 RepID=A0A521BBU6_SACCC|nr:hypothetical protein [Saccharicrinis carchari]SMO44574.1 hypothetical protein SAMN06265379_101864 [Saccharicrinis carchari]